MEQTLRLKQPKGSRVAVVQGEVIEHRLENGTIYSRVRTQLPWINESFSLKGELPLGSKVLVEVRELPF